MPTTHFRNTRAPRIGFFLYGILIVATSLCGQNKRPDVLMIAIDDLRTMLGCYDDARAKTPNIDRLAERSVVFERAYCQYSKCGPSRLSLMTGLRPDSTGVFNHSENDLEAFRSSRPDAISLARWLKDQGYHTRSFGKIYHDGWDLPSDWSEPSQPGRENEILEIQDPANPGGPSIIADRRDCPVMQSPDVEDDYLFAGRMTNEAIAALTKKDTGKPRFLAVGYRRPHLPFVAPKKYFDLHQPDPSWLAENQMPPMDSPVYSWFTSNSYFATMKRAGVIVPDPPGRELAISVNGYELRSYNDAPDEGELSVPMQLKILQAYAACVSYVDTQIGRLLDALETSGRLDNTLIILWTDHGYHLGELSAWAKQTNFEVATRVPLMISGPGIKPARTRHITELVDIYPTLCDILGMDPPAHLEGESLLPVLNSPANIPSSTALTQVVRVKETVMGSAMRTDRYRYVLWTERKSGRVLDRELYDYQSDPLETRNLAAQPELETLIQKLEEQLIQAYKLNP